MDKGISVKKLILTLISIIIMSAPSLAQENTGNIPLRKLIEARSNNSANYTYGNSDLITVSKELFDLYTKTPQAEFYCKDKDCKVYAIRYVNDSL